MLHDPGVKRPDSMDLTIKAILVLMIAFFVQVTSSKLILVKPRGAGRLAGSQGDGDSAEL